MREAKRLALNAVILLYLAGLLAVGINVLISGVVGW